MSTSEAKRGTILILTQVYVPDPAAVGQYMHDAAAELARRGNRVIVYAASRGYDDPTIVFPAREVRDGVEIRRLPLSSFGKTSIPLRILGGVLLMFGAILVLFVLPWLDRSPVRSARFRPLFRIFFWLLFIDALALGYLGGMPAEGIYVVLSRIATAWYFMHFLLILPLLSVFETTKPLPKSISEPVLAGGTGAVNA